MDVAFQFNASQYTPQFEGGSSGLPLGKHPVILNSADWKATKSGDGSQMLVLTAEAFDGVAKGQTQEIRLNVQNTSAVASKIAYQQLAAICVVCGVPQGIMQSAGELFNKPFILEIRLQRETEANKGKGYTEPANVYFMDGRDCTGAMPKGQVQTQGFIPQQQPQPGPQAFAPQAPQPQPQFQPQGGGFQPQAPQPGPGAFQPQQQPMQPQPQFAPQPQPQFQPQPQPQAPQFGGMPAGAQMPAPPAGGGTPWQR